MILQHPRSSVRHEPPVTEASTAQAHRVQLDERAEALAVLLADFDDVVLAQAPEPVKAHYRKWGWIALRGAGTGKGQFTIVAVGLHTAAQAAHDCDSQLNFCPGVDLLSEQHQGERQHWNKVADAAVQSYLRSLGKQDARVEHVLGYARRMGLEP